MTIRLSDHIKEDLDELSGLRPQFSLLGLSLLDLLPTIIAVGDTLCSCRFFYLIKDPVQIQ